MANTTLVPPLDASILPRLTRETILAMNFGEACLVEEYLFLHGLVAMLQPKTILEIGTSFGVGSIAMLDAATAFGRSASLTTIDIRRCDEFDANIGLFPGLAERLERVVEPSEMYLPTLVESGRRFDLIFIDGDHSFEHASLDWQYCEKLGDRWILHDTTQMSGCRQVVAAIRETGTFDVLSFEYPQGHQVWHGCEAVTDLYEGLYHQQQLVWTRSNTGPGLTLVQRRSTRFRTL